MLVETKPCNWCELGAAALVVHVSVLEAVLLSTPCQ